MELMLTICKVIPVIILIILATPFMIISVIADGIIGCLLSTAKYIMGKEDK